MIAKGTSVGALAGGLAACALSLGIVGAAAGHTASIESRVTFDSLSPARAKGTVESKRARCEPKRRVEVFLEAPGPDRSFGTDRTDERGRWTVDASFVPGEYYAQLSRNKLKRPGHVHTCLDARSDRMFL